MIDGHEAARQRSQGGLSTYYYHEHFVEMLGFVSEHYAHALDTAHEQFLEDYTALPIGAQRLFVRLANRRGRVYCRRRLRYPEIGDLGPPLAALERSGFVGPPGPEHYGDLLRFLTRAELRQALAASFVGLARGLRKTDLVAFAREHCPAEDFIAIADTSALLVQRRVDALGYLLFLYFGRAEQSLSRFTMRDLGLVRTQTFRDRYEPRFSDLEDALENYYFASRLARLDSPVPGTHRALLRETGSWPEPGSPAAAGLRDRLAQRLGRYLEKAGDADRAISVYRLGESTACGERIVRLLLAAGRREDARRYLEQCLDSPQSDEEWLFARDVYEQKFGAKRTSALTDVLRAAETIDLDECLSGAPERAAADWFEGRGERAYRTENALWRTFFGLLFWNELFGADTAAVHSPFEMLPASLTDGSFYAGNEAAIEARLALLDDGVRLRHELLRVSTRRYGTPNGVFRWRRSIIEALFALLDAAPAEGLRTVLRRLAQDYGGSRHGYPDLLVIDRNGARFIEIKTEGDQLRRNQLLRIEQLRAAGLEADVVRVRWVLDPAQTYVVVDVETTGGKGEAHRVTEVAAVKVRGGRVVGRYSTLVNPQRPIPAGITRLTGITASMVAGAPPFADIADEFAAFLDGSIFVAHNVAFDYGFLSREYERLGRGFRYPRLCTCASMRRLYPGHRSYSLAALCEAYDVPLKSHHRALCDAEAAAQLLLIVNEKRQALLDAAPGSRTDAAARLVG